MTLEMHIQATGACLLLLGLAHAFFPRYFGWRNETARLSVLTRQVFGVHTFFIGLLLVLLGLLSVLYAGALLQPGPLSRAILAGNVIFWICRLSVQWFVYSPAIWRGNRFYTAMHAVFSGFWLYLVATYSLALHHIWRA